MGAEAGLATAKSITKQISKLAHKIKKKYKKAVKKAKKKEAKRIAKLQAQQEQQRRAYYRKIAWQREQAEKAQRLAYTHYDQYGNGYSSMYNNYYSDGVKTNSFLAYPSTAKTPWYKRLFGATALASTIKVDYKPKKSWFGKIKDFGKKIGGSVWGGLKNKAQKIINTPKTVWNGTKNTYKFFGNVAKKWYDMESEEYDQKSTWDKIKIASDVGGDLMGVVALGAYGIAPTTFGGGAIAGLALDGVGALLDVTSGVMYAVDGDWKKAGWKGLSILPAIGGGVAIARRSVGLGKAVRAVIEETKAMTKLREAYAPFADNVYTHFSDMIRTFDVPKGFEVMSRETLKKVGFSKSALTALKGSKGIIYINKKTKELVTAFSGTRTDNAIHFTEDMIDNILAETGKLPENYKLLPELASELDSKFVGFVKTIVAHSKGADSASVVGGLGNFKTVLFNPKSINGKFLGNFKGLSSAKVNKVVDYFIQRGDFLQELRKVTEYSPKGTGYLVGEETLLDKPTLTLGALLGKWIKTKPLTKHGEIFKSLTR